MADSKGDRFFQSGFCGIFEISMKILLKESGHIDKFIQK